MMKKTSYSKYRDNLSIFDQCFGLYFTFITLISYALYFQDKVELIMCVMLTAFVAVNLLISRMVYSSENVTKLEIFRVYVFNGVLAPSLFYYSTGPIAHFWSAFLIGSISGSILILGATSNRRFAYSQTIFWVILYGLTNHLLGERGVDWNRWAMMVALMTMLTGLFTEVVNTLTVLAEKETEARAQLFQASKLSSLGEMAGGIAHEINNPLAIIASTVRIMRKMILQKKAETDDFNDLLSTVDSTIVRITKIVSGLRNLSRNSRDEEFETCTVMECLSDALALSSEKFKSHGISLQLEMTEELKIQKIRILRVQISQVFLNLLVNAYDAVEYLEEKWIKLQVEDTGNSITIRITDSGQGIPVEIRPKLFQPFFTTKEIGKGTGLGLSLSHSIISKHSGEFFLLRH